MTALSPFSKNYHTRANIPFGSNNTTTALVHQYFSWLFKSALMNELTGGSTGGTRHANSVWTCKGSSNGTTATNMSSPDNTDRWTTTFSAANHVMAASGTAHSWIVLENSTAGYQICMDLNSATPGTMGIAATKISQPFIGGSVTTRPQTSGASEEFMCSWNGTTQVTTTTACLYDMAAGGTHWFHVTFDDNGFFHILLSKGGAGVFNTSIAFIQAVNGRAGDTRNVWWISGASPGARGSPAQAAFITNNNTVRRGYNNAISATQGGGPNQFGASHYIGQLGADAITSEYWAFPVQMAQLNPGPVFCGQLPDWYFVGNPTVGSSIPNSAAQERIVAGDVIVPFISIVPNL